jgi:P27 family predicted phage terminase small subunit
MPTERKDLSTHNLQSTRPEYADEYTFAHGRPQMPKDLPPLGVEEWKRTVPKLCKRKQLTKADATCLEVHCRVYARWRKVEAMAAENPLSETSWIDSKGVEHVKVEESPASKIASRLESQLRAFLIQMSCTPASRKLTKPDLKTKPDLTAAEKAMLSRDSTQPTKPEEEEDPLAEALAAMEKSDKEQP